MGGAFDKQLSLWKDSNISQLCESERKHSFIYVFHERIQKNAATLS